MDYRILSDVVEFQQQFARVSGVPIPLEYFRESVVMGAFDGTGALAGGWATAPGTVGRWIAQIPDVHLRCAQVRVERSFELNGVWLAGRLRGQAASAEFWRALARDIAGRDVDHVIFGVNPKKSGLARLYASMALGVLYEGPILNSVVPAIRYFHSAPHRFAEIEDHYAARLHARAAAGARRALGTTGMSDSLRLPT